MKASIIILNYFGERVIKESVESVIMQTFPKKEYEIIIVDNNSQDNSIKILSEYAKKYPRIKLVILSKNKGFAGGNNKGIKQAKGEYIVLLNNDCVADENWLKNLIECAESDKKVFSVASKILIYPRYFTISFKSNGVLKSCKLYNTRLLRFGKDRYLEVPLKKDYFQYFIDIPFEESKDKNLDLILEFEKYNDIQLKIKGCTDYKISSFIQNTNSTTFNVSLKIDGKLDSRNYYNKIQNAGSIVFQDGYSRDIGATVMDHRGDYERDFGQYDHDREVYSTCGAAVLYRKSIVDQIGFLNEDFFMYYEDTEICERAQLAGYKNYYSHKAVVRHLHALSSKEWSPFFIYHTELGRLLHIFFHFPSSIFLRQFLSFIKTCHLRFIHDALLNPKRLVWDIQYIQVVWRFIIKAGYLIQRRAFLNKNNTVSIKCFYERILEGQWLK